MKQIKLCLLLCVGIALSACTNNAEEILITNESNAENELIDANVSRELYGKLLDYLKSVTRTTNIAEPEYYGGAYFSENKLHVLLTDKQFAPDFLLDNPNAIIELCEYSQQELNYIMDVIDDFKNVPYGISPIADNLIRWQINTIDNRVEVFLKQCTNSTIREFKNLIIDSPALVFYEADNNCNLWEKTKINYLSEILTRATVNAYPGMAITAAPSGATMGNPGSLGYKAKIGTTVGFIISGHVAAKNDIIARQLSTGQNVMGICQDSRHENGGNIDAAFCVLTSSSFSLVNYIKNNTSLVLTPSIYDKATVGTDAYLAGANTSSSGKIVNMRVSTTDEEKQITITQQVLASYYGIDGDSGGLVYTMDAGKYYILGIHHSSDRNSTNVSTYCPASTIQSVMNAVPCN